MNSNLSPESFYHSPVLPICLHQVCIMSDATVFLSVFLFFYNSLLTISTCMSSLLPLILICLQFCTHHFNMHVFLCVFTCLQCCTHHFNMHVFLCVFTCLQCCTHHFNMRVKKQQSITTPSTPPTPLPHPFPRCTASSTHLCLSSSRSRKDLRTGVGSIRSS